MRTIGVVACYALVIVLTLLVPVSAQVSDFTTIDVPGASSTLPRGINPRGDIVGFYGVGGVFHAFLLHEGKFTDIDVPGAAFTRPRSINPQGDVVGFSGTGSVSHGFLLLEGSFTTIDVPGASSTQAFGINPRGDIVGQTRRGTTQSFLLHKGTFTTIDVPGASSTRAFGINPRVTSWARTLLGGPRMGSCSTRTAASPALTFLAPHPPGPSVSTLWGTNQILALVLRYPWTL